MVRTDHGSLRWLLNFKQAEDQLARWIEILSMYEMTVEHRPGTQHRNADAISQRPCGKCKYDPDWDPSLQKSLEIEPQKVLGVCSESKDESVKAEDEELSLVDLQSKDKEISAVKQWLLDNKPSQTDLSYGGVMSKSLWSQRNMLEKKDELIYKKWTDDKGTTLQAAIPPQDRRKVLAYCHNHKTAGHLGVRKTLSKIRQTFYWPGMQRDVRHYVKGCDVCSRYKGLTQTKRAPMKTLGAGMPMERIGIDIVGELPRTEEGNRYIVVICDYFTKWVEAFAMPNMETVTIAKLLVEQVISRFGVPKSVHLDQGKQFEGKIFTEKKILLPN